MCVCVCVHVWRDQHVQVCERNSCNGCRESSIDTSILAHADLREVEGKAFLMSPPRAVHSYSIAEGAKQGIVCGPRPISRWFSSTKIQVCTQIILHLID